MALERTQGQIYRWGVASPLAFEDWKNPTVAELNANPDNDPTGLIFNLTCALDTDGTQFDLTDPDTDDSTSFCQDATESTPISQNVDIVFEFFRATEEGKIDDPQVWNTAHLAFTLLAWRGVEFFFWKSVGESPDAPFEAGQRISLARAATDWAVDSPATSEVLRMTQTPATRGDILWNYELA